MWKKWKKRWNERGSVWINGLGAMLAGVALLILLTWAIEEGVLSWRLISGISSWTGWTAAAAVGSCLAAIAAATMVGVTLYIYRSESNRRRQEISWDRLVEFRTDLDIIRHCAETVTRERVDIYTDKLRIIDLWEKSFASVLEEAKPSPPDGVVREARRYAKDVDLWSSETKLAKRMAAIYQNLDRLRFYSPDLQALLLPAAKVIERYTRSLEDPERLASALLKELQQNYAKTRKYTGKPPSIQEAYVRGLLVSHIFDEEDKSSWEETFKALESYVDLVSKKCTLGKATKGIVGNWHSKYSIRAPAKCMSDCVIAHRAILGSRSKVALRIAKQIERKMRAFEERRRLEGQMRNTTK
jgi:hypothetical protein